MAIPTASIESPRSSSPGHSTGWITLLVRVTVTADASLVVAQALLAGQFIDGNFAALAWHQVVGIIAWCVAITQLAALTLEWRRGGMPGWAPLAGLVLVGAVAEQIHTGFARVLALHVPLGVAIVVATALLLVWAWRSPPGSPPVMVAPDDGEAPR
jgi:hypothetical protein